MTLTLAEKFHKARAVLGLSRAQAAYKWEINLKTLEAWEAGTRKPPAYVARLLHQMLDSIIEKRP